MGKPHWSQLTVSRLRAAIVPGIALLVLSFIAAMPAAAQFTSVSATVTDPNGLVYAGATVKVQLLLNGAASGQATVTISNAQQCASSGLGSAPCNLPIQSTYGPITLSGAGAFTITLPDVTLIKPAAANPQYLFTINSGGIAPPGGTGPQTFTYTSTGTLVSGASVSLSTQISALAPALGFAGTGGVSSLTYSHINTNASTVVRSGSGMLGVIQINQPGAGWTVQIFDNTSCTGTQIGLTASLLQLPPARTLNYYVTFNTGLCILTAGSIPGDISVGFTSTPGTFSYSNITANTNTQVKSVAGKINWIQVNNPGAGWLLTLFDNTSCTGTVIAGPSELLQGVGLLKLNASFLTGLCIASAGTVPGNVTVASN